MPAGVALTDDERDEIDPDATGLELYAPVYAYIFRASGRITGAFDGVLTMQRQLRELDFDTVQVSSWSRPLSILVPECSASPIASPFRVE